jgi:hypothetical protein
MMDDIVQQDTMHDGYATFVAHAGAWIGKRALLRDPYWERRAIFSGIMHEEDGRGSLCFTGMLCKPRFTSEPFSVCFREQDWNVRVGRHTIFTHIENRSRWYVALVPGVNHIYIG